MKTRFPNNKHHLVIDIWGQVNSSLLPTSRHSTLTLITASVPFLHSELLVLHAALHSLLPVDSGCVSDCVSVGNWLKESGWGQMMESRYCLIPSLEPRMSFFGRGLMASQSHWKWKWIFSQIQIWKYVFLYFLSSQSLPVSFSETIFLSADVQLKIIKPSTDTCWCSQYKFRQCTLFLQLLLAMA